jgi:hypothetical protein
MDATRLQEAASLASVSNALLSAMKDFPTEIMQRMIPEDSVIMLGMVSKEVRAALGRVKPAARVRCACSQTEDAHAEQKTPGGIGCRVKGIGRV